MLVLGALPSLTHAECNNPGDYIMLDFNTSLVRSNLGGQGGRCTELGACDELQTTSTPHELYFRDIAISYDKLMRGGTLSFDMTSEPDLAFRPA